jgi:hypothetical protein
MSRRKHHAPHHENPHELRLRAAVNGLVSDETLRPAYLAFAHELIFAERLGTAPDSPEFRIQKPECRGRNESHPQISQITQMIRFRRGRPRRYADYTRRTKLTVMKWFRRGLSGHLMWLIGREILGESE